MKVHHATWMLLFACLSITGCAASAPLVVGSGVIAGESYDFAGFERVTVHHAWDVTVLQGDGYAVEVSADDNLLEFVKVEQRGDELRIGLSRPLNLRNATLLCVVHLPRLTTANVNGASRLRLEAIASEQLQLVATGASRIEGEFHGGRLDVNASGASQIRLHGQAESADVVASGASQANLEHLVAANRMNVHVNGASRAQVHARGELSMLASGASNIWFQGAANITRQETHGASTIRPMAGDESPSD